MWQKSIEFSKSWVGLLNLVHTGNLQF